MTNDGLLIVKSGRLAALLALLTALTLVFVFGSNHAHALGADTAASSIAVTASPSIIPADGITASALTATVTDASAANVPDGTIVNFSTTLGTLSSGSASTVGGTASVRMVSTMMGAAAIVAQSGTATGSAEVTVAGAGTPASISITLPSSCPTGASCAINVVVKDAFGNMVPDGAMVFLSVSDGSLAANPVATSGGTASFAFNAPATTEAVVLTATNATAPQATTNLQVGALVSPGSLPVQQTVVATSTGAFCFSYDGPATTLASFTTAFSSTVASVNSLQLPAGNYLSWFRAAPALATATSLSSGQIVCVSAPVGSSVFSQS